MRNPDIETAVRFYYEKPELTTKDIKELFGVCDSKACVMKKKVKEEMIKSDVKSWLPYSINTRVAYKLWGIDIEDFESRLKKIRRLRKE